MYAGVFLTCLTRLCVSVTEGFGESTLLRLKPCEKRMDKIVKILLNSIQAGDKFSKISLWRNWQCIWFDH